MQLKLLSFQQHFAAMISGEGFDQDVVVVVVVAVVLYLPDQLLSLLLLLLRWLRAGTGKALVGVVTLLCESTGCRFAA